MIVVDTSVWVDVLNDNDTKAAERCVELIENGEPVALTDVVFTEILQGLGSEEEAQLVEDHLRAFPILRLDGLEDFALAAELYRSARRAGVTIRKTLDCLIAAPCVRTGAPLLHADADFDRLATCTSLRLYPLD
jgi:predicted nucleic acid-binding protein